MQNSLSLGQKIRKYRLQTGKSQYELELQMGASPGTISRIEKGKTNPSKETLIRIIEILGINSREAVDLFELNSSYFAELIRTTHTLNGSLEIEDILQAAVNEITKALDLLGAGIFLVKGDRVFAQTQTQTWFTAAVHKVIKVPYNSLNASLIDHKDNLIVMAVKNKETYPTMGLTEISKHVFEGRIISVLERIIGVKSGIVVPILYNDISLGAIYFGKNSIDDFSSEIEFITAFADNVALAIINARKYHNLIDEITKLKNAK